MSPIRKTLHRYEIPNHARFFTFSCDHRLPYFEDEEAKDIFAQQLFLTRARFGFKLHAWVIMPEHVHLLITPNLPEVTISKILMALKRPAATKLLRHFRASMSTPPQRFWQPGGGYDRNIYTQKAFNEKIQYIHMNPVHRELVQHPNDWAWSSSRNWSTLDTPWPQTDR